MAPALNTLISAACADDAQAQKQEAKTRAASPVDLDRIAFSLVISR
jgi:hypothetical protein